MGWAAHPSHAHHLQFSLPCRALPTSRAPPPISCLTCPASARSRSRTSRTRSRSPFVTKQRLPSLSPHPSRPRRRSRKQDQVLNPLQQTRDRRPLSLALSPHLVSPQHHPHPAQRCADPLVQNGTSRRRFRLAHRHPTNAHRGRRPRCGTSSLTSIDFLCTSLYASGFAGT
ncbi:hypothetical protein BD626DRAFT_21032 [Schizophyllum amplum]|uniref:Uncharacterized protein n=1 Tax=Schizophyllum amplum TaxID=97359 RepID=A0A550CYV9_9AGAR|nr:hypothetical protein BD626DRAFT_21032 [Auriculariopsis ampla]